MTPSLPHSYLAEGNQAFREKNYKRAIFCYETAIANIPELSHTIEFNISLVRKRLMNISGWLSCPDQLDEYVFSKIVESGLFDSDWYVKEYRERYQIGDNPLEHYLSANIAEGLNPSTEFNTKYYLAHNEDLNNLDIHPFIHFVVQGRSEGRQAIGYQTHHVERYVPLAQNPPSFKLNKTVRIIAFFLPQFHPIPENDKWWGTGFTEWTNVRPAKPMFEGHYQPHVPDSHLGYYDLLDAGIQKKQVELADLYGISGFCFYYYWFSGKRLLEQPVEAYFNNKQLELPYCLCWANENWTRRWDGLDQDILIKQDYSKSDDLNFITNISKHFKDHRYIRIDGRPLLIIYRPNLFPDMRSTVDLWREWCKRNGVGDIYIAYPQSFESVDPDVYGFDAAIEFPPVSSGIANITKSFRPIHDDFQCNVYDWKEFVRRSENYDVPSYKLFRTLCPGWDNTARKKNKSSVLVNNTPSAYHRWMSNAIRDTIKRSSHPDESLIFVNAWNEWAEGAHLEPDRRTGFAYLEATRQALLQADIIERKRQADTEFRLAIVIHAFYVDVFEDIVSRIPKDLGYACKLFISTIENNLHDINRIASRYKMPFEVHAYNNHGRDILPFIKITNNVRAQGYEYLLKLHTKKSLHRTDGDVWRNDIYDKLLNERLFNTIDTYSHANPEVGLVAPDGYVAPLSYYWGCNKDNVAFLAGRLGIEELNLNDHQFIAGTMFYARLLALEPILNIAMPDHFYEVEAGQVDGTMAHAIERVFCLSGHVVEYRIASTEDVKGKSLSKHVDTININNFYEAGK